MTPSTIEEITPEWLTDILARGGYLTHVKVVGITMRPIGAGIGFLSKIVQVRLEYDHHEPDAPSSLVVKLELVSGELRNLSDRVHAFEREVQFYREVAPLAPIRLARCYHAATGPPSSVLVMEDLTSSTPCDQVVGLHKNRVIEVARLIGRFQAAFWNSEALSNLTWMPKTNFQFWGNYDSIWDTFVGEFAGELDVPAWDLGEQLRGRVKWLEAAVEGRPRTLVHSDLKADNILIGPSGRPDSIVILDWQLAIRSMGAFDIARLMGGSELPRDRHGHQLDVLRSWYDEVIQGGADYSWEEALGDLRLGALQMICWAVQFHAYVAGSGGRPKELVKHVCERAFDSAVEMEAQRVLPRNRS